MGLFELPSDFGIGDCAQNTPLMAHTDIQIKFNLVMCRFLSSFGVSLSARPDVILSFLMQRSTDYGKRSSKDNVGTGTSLEYSKRDDFVKLLIQQEKSSFKNFNDVLCYFRWVRQGGENNILTDRSEIVSHLDEQI